MRFEVDVDEGKILCHHKEAKYLSTKYLGYIFEP